MTYKFNNFETEIDNTDVDFLEKYLTEMSKLGEAAKEMDAATENGDAVASFRIGCEAVDRLFNSLFGEGSAEKMFDGKRSFNEHLRTVTELRKTVDDYSEITAINTEIRTLTGQPNRAARRATSKKKA